MLYCFTLTKYFSTITSLPKYTFYMDFIWNIGTILSGTITSISITVTIYPDYLFAAIVTTPNIIEQIATGNILARCK